MQWDRGGRYIRAHCEIRRLGSKFENFIVKYRGGGWETDPSLVLCINRDLVASPLGNRHCLRPSYRASDEEEAQSPKVWMREMVAEQALDIHACNSLATEGTALKGCKLSSLRKHRTIIFQLWRWGVWSHTGGTGNMMSLVVLKEGHLCFCPAPGIQYHIILLRLHQPHVCIVSVCLYPEDSQPS